MIDLYILECDTLYLHILTNSINKIASNKNIDINIFKLYSISQAFVTINTPHKNLRIYILNIKIQEENDAGIKLAAEIRKKDKESLIIFFSSYTEFICDTFRLHLDVTDFIEKSLYYDNRIEFYKRLYAVKRKH